MKNCILIALMLAFTRLLHANLMAEAATSQPSAIGSNVASAATAQSAAVGSRLVDYVNPFIGTGVMDAAGLSGATFPGATTPFGLVQLSPDTTEVPGKGLAPPSGYDYNAKSITGFSHTHLSGVGVADLYDVLLMPATGELLAATDKSDKLGVFRSSFEHTNETAQPGYYQVYLSDYGINVELTATEHAGFHKYTFPKSAQSRILIDLNHSFDKKRTWYPAKIMAHIQVVNDHVIEGYRIITGWGVGYRKVYFRAEFSKPFAKTTLLNTSLKQENLSVINGSVVKALLDFETESNEVILVKVGLSTTSPENARLNLSAELPGWDFEATRNAASNTWENELKCITVEGTQEQKNIFYTALYHAFIQPNNLADVNGDYTGTDMVVRRAADKHHYSTFSLWDTYRAAHPLYTLIQTKRTAGFVNSMLRQYETYGYLPIWQLWGLENYCMIGNHAIPVIVDAALKDIPGFDLEKAYAAVKASALTDHYSDTKHHGSSLVSVLGQYGYLPEDIIRQSVSMTLEMAYDDWCVAQLALKLGKTEDYQKFLQRSANYQNLFDAQTHFFRPKNKDGKWIEPFDPLKYSGNGDGPFTEGNAWHYLFYVPQDMGNLIRLMGGPAAFNAKLDTLFTLEDKSSKINHNASGFIGQYAHGNEPSHHVAYLYNFSGQPWKTQKYVSQVLNSLYKDSPAGYCGNEDCGQMSAWYVFSSMGFYPVNPANGIYAIGSPLLKSARVRLENGKFFTMRAANAGEENPYIQSLKLNGQPYTKTYITHRDIMDGGTLEFVMGSQPNLQWGIKNEDIPPISAY
jgi:predicted alpha-1,2-mannosidase